MPSAMQTAILSNSVETVRQTLTSTTVNTVDSDGYTPLYFACMKPSVGPAVVEELLRLGATVDGKGVDEETPLYIAVFNGRADMAKLLLSRGASAVATNGPRKETPLHVAARFGNEQIVALLLKSGADVNARNGRQETPLYAAAKAGRHESACLLLEADANPALANEDGKTPLYIASERGYKHVVLVLKADRSQLRHAKAEADAELRLRPMPLPTSEELAARAASDKEFAAALRRRSSLPGRMPDTTPMAVVDIHVPQPRTSAVDPLTGKSNGPCRSLEEVGYDEPPPIPKELQNRPPAQLPRIGGTSMVVGTGTEEGGRPPIRLDLLGGDTSVEFYSPPKH